MDNLTEAEAKRKQLILQIQELHKEGASISEIARIMKKCSESVKKYLEGNPDHLCRSNRSASSLHVYEDYIIQCILDGDTQAAIVRNIEKKGYSGTASNLRQYIRNLAITYQLELTRYCRSSSEHNDSLKKILKADRITRKGIFNYLWMNGELTPDHHEYLWKKYPVLQELEKCIREFRELFSKKNLPMLYLFIKRYQNSKIKELASFARGLDRDIDAVENAVSSHLSNGFVEGHNSKLKTVKKTMYGRCGIELLSAKLMYVSPT